MPRRSLPHAWTRAPALALVAVFVGVSGAAAQSPTATTRVGLRGPTVTAVGAPTETTPSVVVPTFAPPATTVSAPIASTTSPTTSRAPSPPTSTTSTTPRTAGATSTTLVPPPSTGAQLRERVRAALARSTARQRGVYVAVDGLGALYDENGDTALAPASSQKVVVAGTALLALGPDHRFVTVVRADGPVVDGVLQGDLVLVAGGDPSFTATDLLGLAGDVASAGVRKVSGDVVVDDSHFDRVKGNAGWKPGFQPGEVGTLSALLVDGNKRGDSATIADPGLANAARFKQYLVRRKVTVAGIVRRSTAGASMPVLATHRSAPMTELVAHMLKKSDNTYAEALLKELGGLAGTPSTAGGISVVNDMFDRFGVSRPVLGDGSGLSSVNRSSARRTVAWLSHLADSSVGPTLRTSLAIACVDGTLRSRMCGTPAAGVLAAKTGALDYVVTIAGYTTTASGRAARFCVLLSGVSSSARGRAAIDQALVALTSFTG